MSLQKKFKKIKTSPHSSHTPQTCMPPATKSLLKTRIKTLPHYLPATSFAGANNKWIITKRIYLLQRIHTFNFSTADPDQILPAEKFSTYLRHEPVKLRLNGPEAEKPISVPTLLVNTVKRHGHGTALGMFLGLYFSLLPAETKFWPR